MSVHYIYIDDDPNSNNKIQGFEKKDHLSIETVQHEDSWELQMGFLKQKESSIDGLILDLKLDDLPNKNDQRANFRGTSLAQEIRTRQKEGVLNSFPIVLFSANDKIKLSLENSGKDLFDICIDKSNISIESFSYYTPKLIALAEGYKTITDSKQLNNIFNQEVSYLDSRFVSEYEKIKCSPTHVQARFLITEFLEKQGLLIDEDVLASRLGIDKTSSQDWELLKAKLSCVQYRGVFCEGWQRWWAHMVEIWWNNEVISETSLRSLSAHNRVDYIKESTGLGKLQAAERIEKCDSEEFWTICKAYNRPLDPIDGLLIEDQDNLYPWQEPEYVSIDAALKKRNVELWHGIADVEKGRFDELKEVYSHRKQQ